MRVRDLMRQDLLTVTVETTVSDLCDLIQQSNVHGAPVVGEDGKLIGFVSQEDILMGSLGEAPLYVGGGKAPESAPDESEKTETGSVPTVGDIMTSPAISVPEDADVREAARILWTLRIHHVPVVRGHRLVGIVSTMDFCGLVADGKFRADG